MRKTLFKSGIMAAAAATMLAAGLASCSDDDTLESTLNPAEKEVFATKRHDTALLLCTFGSTYKESLDVYDKIQADFKAAFPDADIYVAFTSATCINRAYASTGVPRYAIDHWLHAIGKAGYKRLMVQSLHVIPGEEYLALMNGNIKKDFMIQWYPKVEVLKGANLLADDSDTEAVADVLYSHYSDVLADKRNIVLLMGHGNPDKSYSANRKYADVQEALHRAAAHNNIFVGTVDYGEMLFWPGEDEENPADRISDESIVRTQHPGCIYSQLMAYCERNGLQPADVRVFLAPFMSIAGDHAHNDLWGMEALAENAGLDDVELNTNEFSWRERLMKAGFDVQTGFENHPTDQAGADHGIESGCGIKALGSYPEIRQIWVKHMRHSYEADAWENGEDYQ